MRRVAVARLRPGMVLARPVQGPRGQTLLAAGTTLRDQHVQHLASAGVAAVYVEDPRYAGLEWEEDIPPAAVAEAEAWFASWERDAAEGLPVRVDPTRVARLVSALAEAVRPGGPVAPLPVLEPDRYLPIQAVNGAALALAAAGRVRLGAAAFELATAALLRDVGMVAAVPREVREHPGPLGPAEWEVVRGHVAATAWALDDPAWHPLVKVAVWQHHERLDGSGYPRGLRGQDIHPGALLLGAIDTYLALVAPRPHRRALRPDEALEVVLGSAGWLFPAEVAEAVASTVGLYPFGALVRLSSGEEAVVVHPGRGTFERPRVRLAADGRVLDLGAPAYLHVRVEEVLEA
jgi:hypothetical protein